MVSGSASVTESATCLGVRHILRWGRGADTNDLTLKSAWCPSRTFKKQDLMSLEHIPMTNAGQSSTREPTGPLPSLALWPGF